MLCKKQKCRSHFQLWQEVDDSKAPLPGTSASRPPVQYVVRVKSNSIQQYPTVFTDLLKLAVLL